MPPRQLETRAVGRRSLSLSLSVVDLPTTRRRHRQHGAPISRGRSREKRAGARDTNSYTLRKERAVNRAFQRDGRFPGRPHVSVQRLRSHRNAKQRRVQLTARTILSLNVYCHRSAWPAERAAAQAVGQGEARVGVTPAELLCPDNSQDGLQRLRARHLARRAVPPGRTPECRFE